MAPRTTGVRPKPSFSFCWWMTDSQRKRTFPCGLGTSIIGQKPSFADSMERPFEWLVRSDTSRKAYPCCSAISDICLTN